MQVLVGGLVAGNQITTQHKDEQLELVKQEKSLNWDKHSLRITNAEMRTMDINHVLSVMKGDDLTPSFLAGLKPREIVCNAIHLIDTMYYDTILVYKQRLAKASGADLKAIRDALEDQKWAREKLSGVGILGGAACGVGIGSPLGPVGMIVGGVAGSIFGFLAGFFGGGVLKKRYVEREGSAHRIKWMHYIDDAELDRFTKISQLITNTGKPLVEDLIDLEKQNQTDKHKVKQLEQLSLVHKVIFGETAFKITFNSHLDEKVEEIDIPKFIDEIKEKFPALDPIVIDISSRSSSVKKCVTSINELNETEFSKKSKKELPKLGKSISISKKEIIARDLWLNIHTLISDDTEKKVNLVSDYLKIKGFELVGAKSDGDCFCHSFIESYKSFSKKIPVFDQAKDQVQYLKDCISSQYAAIFPQALARIDELKQKGQFLCADGEGDLVAKVLKIPIRVVKAEVNKNGSGINDMLTWPEKNKESEQWGNIDNAKQPKLNEYIFIVDLEGHFVAARPIVEQGF